MPRASTRRQLPSRFRDPHLEAKLKELQAQQQAEAAEPPAPALPVVAEPVEVDDHEARMLEMSRLHRCPPEFLVPCVGAERRARLAKPSLAELLRRNARAQPVPGAWGMAGDALGLHRR